MKEKRHVTDKIMIIEKMKMHQNVKHLLKIYGDPRGSPGDLSKIRYHTARHVSQSGLLATHRKM